MKKMACIVLLASLVLTASTISFAQGPEQMGGQQQMMGQQQQMGQQQKGGMMHGMMSGQMVAVSDGVVVLLGNKLYKYDKDLNLKKEAEIKMEKKTPPQQQ